MLWGYQTYDVIENVQIQFCKYVLGLYLEQQQV